MPWSTFCGVPGCSRQRRWDSRFQKPAEGAERSFSALVRIFSGADHGFANPSGVNYNRTAAEEAWSMTLEFLARTLKQDLAEAG